MNGKAYEHEEDTFNLVLYSDAANYNKSGNRSIWAVFSTLVELPSVLRSCYENIIFHSNWTGSNPDFNIYLEKYNSQIDYIREHGIEFNHKIYKFKIHILIADAPA